MAFAETAQLIVDLKLNDQLSGGVARAEGELAGLNRTAAASGTHTTALAAGFGKAGTAAVTFGGAMSHAGGKIKSLVTGPLGFLGLTGGLIALDGLFASSVNKVEDFGASLEKVQTLTGETALASGALILQFQKFGLGADKVSQVVGFTEKTLGKLNTTAKDGSNKLAELDKTYGLSLIDAKGQVVSFSDVLSQLATFYDSSASASTKAYVASQVFGRGYTQMIPILKEGSAGLRQAAADAASLGLNSADTVKQLAEFHDQMHALENQTNVLQLAIGTALLPSLIELSKAATTFIQENRQGIVDFFRKGAEFAGELGQAINATVVPAIGAIAQAWGAIPGPLKDILIGGFVANKASNFLFGTGLKGIVGSLTGGSLLGSRGQTPANPVFVSDVTGGLGGALGAGEAAAGFLAPGALAAAVAVAVPLVMGYLPRLFPGQAQAGAGAGSQPPLNVTTSQGSFTLSAQQHAIMTGLMPGFDRLAYGSGVTTPTKETMAALADEQMRQVASHAASEHADLDAIKSATATAGAKMTAVLDALHADFQKQLGLLKSPDAAARAAAAKAVAADILKGVGGATSTRNLRAQLVSQMGTETDPAVRAALTAAIAAIDRKLPGREYIAAQEAAADKIKNSNESNGQKIRDLKVIMGNLKDKTVVGYKHVADEIDSLKSHIDAVTAAVQAAGHGFAPGGATPIVSGQTGFTLNIGGGTSDRSNYNARTKATRWTPQRSMVMGTPN